MSVDEVMVKIKKEIIDEVTLSDQKCDMWDINEINYDLYKTQDDSNNGQKGLSVQQISVQDDFVLNQKESRNNQKLTISEIKCETSDINNVVLSESEIKHQDENEEEDYGLCHDCPYGNLLAEEDCAIPQSKMTRRKFLFSPRHFTEHNEFTYSTSSVKKLTYSKKKNVYSGPGNYNIKFLTGETLGFSKKKNPYSGPGNYNIKSFTGETLGLKLSNLSKPINNSHLPIKARIKNSKIELKQSLSTSRTMNLNSMSVYPSTLTNNTLTPFSTISNTINVPKMSINNDTIQNNVLPKSSIRPSLNSDCWYDPVSDLYIPYIPMLPGLHLLSK